MQQRARLDAFPSVLTADAEALIHQEKMEYCIHAYAVGILTEDHVGSDEDDEQNSGDEDELTVDFLSLDPPLVVVFDGASFGLVGFKRTSKLQCLLCDHRCHHVQQFSDWCCANDVHHDKEALLQEGQTFTSVTSHPIPYPLPSRLRSLHDTHERGSFEFPLQLVPPYSPTAKCQHGHLFNSADPIQNGWITKKGVIIHKAAVTIEDEKRTIYFRPFLGSCDCKQAYDGQDDLLFNLDNRPLFYYGYLFQYLHLMLEGKNPLIAFLRASNRSFSVQSHTKPVLIKLLCQAWNAFARLLCIDFAENFCCPICGPTPTTVICDGTLIGFRKDLMETFEVRGSSTQSQQPI